MGHFTYPTNLRAVTQGIELLNRLSDLTLSVLSVTNSHRAFSPSGVLFAFHVRRVIVPSGAPVAMRSV